MAVSEKKVTGKFYRIWSAADKLWHRISFWTHANDVEFNDGKTAQTKVGAIKGITTSTNTQETGYAADATTITTLNQSVAGLNQSLGIDYYTSTTPTNYVRKIMGFIWKFIR